MHDATGVGDRERTSDLVDDRDDVGQRQWAAFDQPFLGVATAQQPHHQVRPARFAPVVVERHDVRVFQPGDELRLGLEPADEVGVVGELGPDDLDGDLPAHRRLHRPMDRSERAFPDALAQLVAANRRAGLRVGVEQHRIVVEDLPFEVAQLRGRIQAEIGQAAPDGLEVAQRLDLPATAIERQHVEVGEALPLGMSGVGLLEVDEDLGVPIEGEFGLEPTLDGRQPELGESNPFGLDPVFTREFGGGFALPQGQRLVEQRNGTCGVARSRRSPTPIDQGHEPVGVDRDPFGEQPVAGAGLLDQSIVEHPSQSRHVRHQGPARTLGWFLIGPHRIDERVDRPDRTLTGDEAQQQPLEARSSDRDGRVVDRYLERSEDSDLHRRSPPSGLVEQCCTDSVSRP